MTERIIDISDNGVDLHVRYDQLLIEESGKKTASVPLCDLAVLIVSHPRVTYSHSVLAGLTAAGGSFIACDKRCLPVGMLLPLDANYVQTERFNQQATASLPTQKRLWKSIIQAKIKAQGNLIKRLTGHRNGFHAMAKRVRSGDPANLEAQASRRYWPLLFSDPTFRRRRNGQGQNALLNYGYAILRAITARAVCAAGLHPSIGIHHHNRYNSYCLADDLMEPFRPIVDGAVVEWLRSHQAGIELTQEAKMALLEAITTRFPTHDGFRTLFDILARVASSLAAVYLGKARNMSIPEF